MYFGWYLQATLDEISREIATDYKAKSCEEFKKCIENRSELPVFAKKQCILQGIKENSIVIIQGSTGCGKTTQVNNNL